VIDFILVKSLFVADLFIGKNYYIFRETKKSLKKKQSKKIAEKE